MIWRPNCSLSEARKVSPRTYVAQEPEHRPDRVPKTLADEKIFAMYRIDPVCAERVMENRSAG